MQVPVIDICALAGSDEYAKASLARLVDDTFVNVGFLSIVGHGVSSTVIDRVEREARAFFALPDAKKLACHHAGSNFNRGYIPVAGEAVGRAYGSGDAPPDLKQAFVIGPIRAESGPGRLPNVWPEGLPAFREAVEQYYLELEKLAFRLLELFALSLRLKEDHFQPFFSDHRAILRLQHYPRQEQAPLPGQLRIAEHTDYGAFTILKGDARSSGLQVKLRNGEWIDVATRDDSFVINVGDMMMTWTNDRWQSNSHRVVNPPLDSAQNADRLTMPFFVNSNPDARIECLPTCLNAGEKPRHPPVTAGEHREAKLRRSA